MIKGLESLRSLRSCNALKNIHLQTMSGEAQNPICGLNGYRKNVLDHLPQTGRLDSTFLVILGIPRDAEMSNGSDLVVGKSKEIKIDVKSIGPFYTNKFPSTAQFVMPTFENESGLKRSIGSCKSSIQELELRMRAALTL